MHTSRVQSTGLLLATLLVGACAAPRPEPSPAAAPSAAALPGGAERVFEIRTYTTPEGKLDALNRRFREHTVAIFARHGMVSVGYWVPTEPPLSQNTLIYVLAHPSREAARQHWADFGRDPEWQRVRAESEAAGPIVSKVESVFVDATDYSPIR
jgi:hypothetical protein